MSHAIATQLALFQEHQRIWCVTRPTQRPAGRFSVAYCLWLANNHRQRTEIIFRQRFMCWRCGLVLNARWMHLHHPNGYANLGYEEASDLVAVHAKCHRKEHEEIREVRRWCGDRAA